MYNFLYNFGMYHHTATIRLDLQPIQTRAPQQLQPSGQLIEVPLALNTAIEERDSINFTLSFACAVVVPRAQICEIINNPQGRHPVVVEYNEDHVGAPGGMDVDVRWLQWSIAGWSALASIQGCGLRWQS
ncbi:hypothetical protein GGX14DRAFT_404816 [Mycena pura]|uniref:Uncharacterized protein n=1 Tax=Mycena pura TaxID=153505 RepID=A0AAD6UTC8_9AGAR|nr:hypothetical protein GGX14DRAFT_404816 [Mycena pura]